MEAETKEILEEAFESEDELEETEDESEDESVDELEDESEDEEESEEEVEEEPDPVAEKAANLERALQSERERRKEATQKYNQALSELQAAKAAAESEKARLAEIMEQIKENDLEDVIEIDEPKVDPRIEQLLREREQQMFVAQMQSEVAKRVGDYKNIDVKSDKQGNILARMIMSNVNLGQSIDEATESALSELNEFLGNTVSSAKKTREAPVKPKRKIKTAVKPKKGSPRSEALKKAMKTGDTTPLFEDVASKLFG